MNPDGAPATPGARGTGARGTGARGTGARGTAATATPTARLRPWFPAYRIAAWTVGIFLIVLTLIGMPLKYLADRGEVVATVGPIHGFGYLAYLAITAMLALRARWRPRTTVLVLLAGTIPFLSFVAERYVVTRTKSGQTP